MDQTRERFLHDMELAGLAERTRTHYLDAVRDYSKYFSRSPRRLGHEHLRVWSRHLLDSGVGDGRLRQHFSALKFLYAKTLARPQAVAFLSFRGKKGPLVDILSAEQVRGVLAALRRPRIRMLFTTMYATGLRLKEARYLETHDINAKRGVIVVKYAKGGTERLVPLSQTLTDSGWKPMSLKYLFPVEVMGELLRGKMQTQLRELHRAGQLPLSSQELERLMQQLNQHKRWVGIPIAWPYPMADW
jgi:site-specific recombinase XerD